MCSFVWVVLNRCGHWGVNTCVHTCSLSWVELSCYMFRSQLEIKSNNASLINEMSDFLIAWYLGASKKSSAILRLCLCFEAETRSSTVLSITFRASRSVAKSVQPTHPLCHNHYTTALAHKNPSLIRLSSPNWNYHHHHLLVLNEPLCLLSDLHIMLSSWSNVWIVVSLGIFSWSIFLSHTVSVVSTVCQNVLWNSNRQLTTVDRWCSSLNCTNEFLIGAVYWTAPITMLLWMPLS